MDLYPNARHVISNNIVVYQFPTIAAQSPVDIAILLLNEQLVSLIPVTPGHDLTLNVPNEFLAIQTQSKIQLNYSARFIFEDSLSQRAAMQCKFTEYGNIRNGNQPIKIDGAPLDPSFIDSKQYVRLQNGFSKMYIPQIESFVQFDFSQLATNPVFTPDPATNCYIESFFTPEITIYGTN